ncbi:hypothetical protein FCN77_01910 [Arthrobacter sp. 24S4-2]|uniref:hypothetical protein n=1 Tax=Arthrobacter sp. 24S4-2 TaxID=2575374 RepID=UPI0010C77A55|nr:hypothetical protein [Arthrobacter sp. 24S4-2]QCO96702.1 hypothetical protein FCN77_01910 [Arthrobacter sp. 24S4-2]
MVTALAHLDRKVAFLFALLFGLAAVGIAVSVLLAVPAGLVNTPVLRMPLENLVTPALGEGNTEVLKAAYATADVQPASLTPTERFLLIGSGLLGGLAGLVSSAAFGLISWSVYRGSGFGKRLALAVGVSGIAVMTWGVLAPLIEAIVHHSVLGRVGLLPEREVGAFFLMELDMWPIAVGLGAAVLASIFETGRRQQVELDGLV